MDDQMPIINQDNSQTTTSNHNNDDKSNSNNEDSNNLNNNTKDNIIARQSSLKYKKEQVNLEIQLNNDNLNRDIDLVQCKYLIMNIESNHPILNDNDKALLSKDNEPMLIIKPSYANYLKNSDMIIDLLPTKLVLFEGYVNDVVCNTTSNNIDNLNNDNHPEHQNLNSSHDDLLELDLKESSITYKGHDDNNLEKHNDMVINKEKETLIENNDYQETFIENKCLTQTSCIDDLNQINELNKGNPDDFSMLSHQLQLQNHHEAYHTLESQLEVLGDGDEAWIKLLKKDLKNFKCLKLLNKLKNTKNPNTNKIKKSKISSKRKAKNKSSSKNLKTSLNLFRKMDSISGNTNAIINTQSYLDNQSNMVNGPNQSINDVDNNNLSNHMPNKLKDIYCKKENHTKIQSKRNDALKDFFTDSISEILIKESEIQSQKLSQMKENSLHEEIEQIKDKHMEIQSNENQLESQIESKNFKPKCKLSINISQELNHNHKKNKISSMKNPNQSQNEINSTSSFNNIKVNNNGSTLSDYFLSKSINNNTFVKKPIINQRLTTTNIPENLNRQAFVEANSGNHIEIEVNHQNQNQQSNTDSDNSNFYVDQPAKNQPQIRVDIEANTCSASIIQNKPTLKTNNITLLDLENTKQNIDNHLKHVNNHKEQIINEEKINQFKITNQNLKFVNFFKKSNDTKKKSKNTNPLVTPKFVERLRYNLFSKTDQWIETSPNKSKISNEISKKISNNQQKFLTNLTFNSNNRTTFNKTQVNNTSLSSNQQVITILDDSDEEEEIEPVELNFGNIKKQEDYGESPSGLYTNIIFRQQNLKIW